MKGLLLIYGDADQLRRHTIEDPESLYVFDDMVTPENLESSLQAAVLAMRRGLKLPEKQYSPPT